MPDVTVDMLMNIENYKELLHRHLSHYISTIDSDQLCSKTKHQPECFKKTNQQLKVNLYTLKTFDFEKVSSSFDKVFDTLKYNTV